MVNLCQLLSLLLFFTSLGISPASIQIEFAEQSRLEPYIKPICSKCDDLELQPQSDSTAMLSFTYYHDVHHEIDGEIELTVHLEDGSSDTIFIHDIPMSDGRYVAQSVQAGPGWGWDDVDSAKVEVIEIEVLE